MQIWLRKRQILNVSISFNKNNMSMRKEISILEHLTLVFELTSFTTDVLGKLIKPRTNGKNKAHYKNKKHVV